MSNERKLIPLQPLTIVTIAMMLDGLDIAPVTFSVYAKEANMGDDTITIYVAHVRWFDRSKPAVMDGTGKHMDAELAVRMALQTAKVI